MWGTATCRSFHFLSSVRRRSHCRPEERYGSSVSPWESVRRPGVLPVAVLESSAAQQRPGAAFSGARVPGLVGAAWPKSQTLFRTPERAGQSVRETCRKAVISVEDLLRALDRACNEPGTFLFRLPLSAGNCSPRFIRERISAVAFGVTRTSTRSIWR